MSFKSLLDKGFLVVLKKKISFKCQIFFHWNSSPMFIE